MLQLKNNNNTIQFLWINYSLVVKIGSVTAEIFLIWTNVARTNVTSEKWVGGTAASLYSCQLD